MSSSNPNSLPGLVTDQPEIFESEPALSDDTGVDLINDPVDDSVALIEVPIKQAFSYFAERENEIAKFYVQRHGEYKIAGNKVDDETDIEKYHRLVSEVNELLNKFQSNREARNDDSEMVLNNTALANNLELLSRQLKALEFAAEDGSLNPTQSEFNFIKSKLEKLTEKLSTDPNSLSASEHNKASAISDENTKLIRMSALERRLNMLETVLGNNDDKAQTLFKTTKCENLTDATNTLASWLSLFKPDSMQRVGRELEYINQRMEKMKETDTNTEENKLDPQSKSKLDHLYDLVTATNDYKAMVPTIVHRLNTMEELQQKAARITTTASHLEQVQSMIVESLQSNKSELSSLTEMFAKNIELIREYSKDIDSRITAIRNRDE